MDIEKEIADLQEQAEWLKEKYPDFQVYITTSKEFNEAFTNYLCSDDYSIRLESLFGCKYQVSPFIDKYNWVVGLFDYSQILGQWNTFQDKMYNLTHLFTYVTSDDVKEEDNDGGTNAE